MVWEKYFPWNPQYELYNSSGLPKKLTQNCNILNCNFITIENGPTIRCESKEIYLLISHSQFQKCADEKEKGVVFIQIAESGGTAIYCSQAVECFGSYSHTFMIESINRKAISRIDQTSISLCGRGIELGAFCLYNKNNQPEHTDINISNCKAPAQIVCFEYTTNCISKYLNIEKNEIQSVLFYNHFRGMIKKSNAINNSQLYTNSGHYGLFCARDPGNHFGVDQVYVFNNKCQSLSYQVDGEVYFFQCYIDTVINTRNAVVAKIVSLKPNIHIISSYQSIKLRRRDISLIILKIATMSTIINSFY